MPDRLPPAKKFSRTALAKMLGLPVPEVLTYQAVRKHPDGRVSFRRRVDRDVWEFRVIHLPA